MENGSAVQTVGASDDHHNAADKDSVKLRSPPSSKPSGHKRSLSGSILSRLNFLRTSSEEVRPPMQALETQDDDDEVINPTFESAMALSQKISKSRKRKGSLRKTALLGTGKMRAEGRERRNSLLQRRPPSKPSSPVMAAPAAEMDFSKPVMEVFERRFSYDQPSAATRSLSAQNLALNTAEAELPSVNNGPTLASPIKSPTSQSYTSTTSTTDEDEALSFSRPANGHVHQQQQQQSQPTKSSASSGDSSYFTSPPPLSHRRSFSKTLSPLSALPMDAYVADDDWDYSETAWWGWVVLIVTWVVFVVGMGSCLEVWSWAWDVGQTPYAPPELEDDPTLPIVGYYPALIVLTGVMAWVWVVTNWLGLKHFKHATIQGDDI